MKTLQQKQLEFLNDTVNHFNSTNRGITPETLGCSYEHGCAIGRHLDKKLAMKLDGCGSGYVSEPEVFNELPEELKELGPHFLARVQSLHDSELNWTEKGLSKHGEKTVFNIKNDLNLFI